MSPQDNPAIARILRRVADLLEAQDENPFRVRSYRNVAAHLESAPREASDLLCEAGPDGLRTIEGVGEGLSRSIAEIIETGRLVLQDRLESELSPEALSCACDFSRSISAA